MSQIETNNQATQSVAFVSGAAGGIGRAVVERFANEGFTVLAFDIDPAVMQMSECKYSAPVKGVVGDHEDLESVEKAFQLATEFGPVRHVMSFAGVALAEELSHNDADGVVHPSLFRATIERNLIGHVNLLWCAQQALFANDFNTSVTLCSSVNANQSWGEPGYSTAKSGLVGLVRSLAGPYGRRGVRINAIAPGTIDSSGAREEYKDNPGRFDTMRNSIPLGRLGQAEDVADTTFAMAHHMRHLNGEVIVLDGGQTVEGNWQLN